MSTATAPETKPARFVKWHHRVLAFCFIVFAFEVGLFLLVFPWMSNWDLNWVPVHSRLLSDLWMSRYFRGALSGLGLMNMYIAFAELARQLRSIFGE